MTDDYRIITETLAAADPDPDQVMRALSSLGGLRRMLDGAERDLIAGARRHGIGWTRIAETLGLQSRQAAEQRWLRLRDPSGGRDPAQTRAVRRSQQIVDSDPVVRRLRKAVIATLAQLTEDWRHPRAGLIRATLEIAADAPPGGLYALVENALADLDTTPTHFPRPSQAATTSAGDAPRQTAKMPSTSYATAAPPGIPGPAPGPASPATTDAAKQPSADRGSTSQATADATKQPSADRGSTSQATADAAKQPSASPASRRRPAAADGQGAVTEPQVAALNRLRRAHVAATPD